MHDLQGMNSDFADQADVPGAPDFTSWVVRLLATRKLQGEQGVRKNVLKSLIAASIHENPAVMDIFLRDLSRQKVSAEALADLYVPAAARELGEGWLDDTHTFVDVTLASSRLQYILRCIGAAWSADLAADPTPGSVLLVTETTEQHSLGALVLMGQLRRRGVSVCILLGATPSTLRDKLLGGNFSAIMVSVGSSSGMLGVKSLIHELRKLTQYSLPIVVGGSIAMLKRDELLEYGADEVADNVESALCACGLVQRDVIARKRA